MFSKNQTKKKEKKFLLLDISSVFHTWLASSSVATEDLLCFLPMVPARRLGIYSFDRSLKMHDTLGFNVA